MIAQQKRCAEQLTSLFENGTTEIQYAYAERLKDGRGITAGRSGFTTATGDAYEVVKIYHDKAPGNLLTVYLPRLKTLAASESGSIVGLKGYLKAWAKAAADVCFRIAQDEVNDRLYYHPAIKYANKSGLRTALSRVLIYDTIIQHGDGDDPDGLRALLNRAETKAGGASTADGINETIWLQAFLAVRRSCLLHANNAATRKEWAESVERCDVFARIAATGNFALKTPFEVIWYGDKISIL